MTNDTTISVREFEEMLSAILSIAFAVALRLVRNPTDAEDLVQEASVNAFRGINTFQRGTSFKAWFLKIMTNCFYARYRKAKREPETVSIDDAPPLYMFFQAIGAGMHERYDDPAGELLSKLDAEKISAALAALPDEYRVVAALYFIDDMSYEEISEIVACPVGTVRSRLHRGRRLLQKALWRIADDHGVVSSMKAGKV
ncbi:MAG: sigma-70 family RNA polymerase sigma factor [bacterium]